LGEAAEVFWYVFGLGFHEFDQFVADELFGRDIEGDLMAKVVEAGLGDCSKKCVKFK